jgi:hypothetical protein
MRILLSALAFLLATSALAVDTDLKQGPGATPQGAWGAIPPAPPTEKRILELKVANALVGTLTTADLKKLKPLPEKGPAGKATIYSLKDVVSTMVAPNAKVVAVHLGTGEVIPVDAKAWTDTTRTPVIWQNRRGLFKLGWIDAKGEWMPATMELRDVRTLDIVK